MPKIFISHAFEDNDLSRKLASSLRREGAEIWVHYSQLALDSSLPKVIRKAIAWCDTVVLLWSRHAAASLSVRLEWQSALIFKKKIIPCLLDDTDEWDQLYDFDCINFTDFDHGYDHLLLLLNSPITSILPSARSAGGIDIMLNVGAQAVAESQYPVAETEAEELEFNESTSQRRVLYQYRSTAQKLSDQDVMAMLKKYNFFDKKRNDSGNRESHFEPQQYPGAAVVMDHEAGLMWLKSGSDKSFWYENARSWTQSLNQNRLAGFADWRLPTLEEAMSLVNRYPLNQGLFLDNAFDQLQTSIWTADIATGGNRAWVVFFNYATCLANCFDFAHYVRPVRSHQQIQY
ncbi:MAG: TIR domain-containing protein [candidate division KSB1 bacterium]|nr:TIR domain-containing protein [candidate division KSB1 bacterium]MDZ7341978.1 TIR domain-containing protein [candidate division KSB1 bacterium]